MTGTPRATLKPIASPRVEAHRLGPSAAIPNNPKLPLLVYRSVLAEPGDRAACFESLFEKNGWHNGWRDSIYRYHHFHTNTHEVLGIAAGRARVLFGGEEGVEIAIGAGDLVVIPAGVAHKRLDEDSGLLVVGAYPKGKDPDMHRETREEHKGAAARAARVPVPERDPLYGADGPLLEHWA